MLILVDTSYSRAVQKTTVDKVTDFFSKRCVIVQNEIMVNLLSVLRRVRTL